MQQQASAPPETKAIVNFLRNSAQVPLRNGLLGGTRHFYFHGTRAVAAILSPEYTKLVAKSKLALPTPKTETEAEQVLHQIIPFAFFLRVERGPRLAGGKRPDAAQTERLRELKIIQQQAFKKEFHYAWFYEGSQLKLQLMGLGLVLVLLAGVMFPLWPPFMRLGVWYLSMGFLGLIGAFFAMALMRLVMWGITRVTVGRGWWLFPNLFADVGVIESFIPLQGWDEPPAPRASKRATEAPTATAADLQKDEKDAIATEKRSIPSEHISSRAENGSGCSTPRTHHLKNAASSAPLRKDVMVSAAEKRKPEPEIKERVKRPSDNLGALD